MTAEWRRRFSRRSMTSPQRGSRPTWARTWEEAYEGRYIALAAMFTVRARSAALKKKDTTP